MGGGKRGFKNRSTYVGGKLSKKLKPVGKAANPVGLKHFIQQENRYAGKTNLNSLLMVGG